MKNNSQKKVDAPLSAFELSGYTVTQRRRVEDALHCALRKEQRVWGSGSEHEEARAKVEFLEAVLNSWPKEKE